MQGNGIRTHSHALRRVFREFYDRKISPSTVNPAYGFNISPAGQKTPREM